MLNSKEDKYLFSLILLVIIMVFITIYLVSNKSYKSVDYIQNKNIHIINTGIVFESTFQEVIDNKKDKVGEYNTDTYKPKINTTEISIKEWNKIAKDIGKVYNKYDAFIILHEKENLSYTAAALSFMLENLDKPVIVTNENVAGALITASTTTIPEVMVYNKGTLLRASRTIETKYGFSAPNYSLTKSNSLTPSEEYPRILFMNSKKSVIVIKLFPTIKPEHLMALIGSLKDSTVNGIILETYANGNSPTNEPFLKTIRKIVDSGIIIINVSQNNQKPGINKKLLNNGVLHGGDMTTQAAFSKLHFLLSNVKDIKIINQLIEQNFRGEMTVGSK
jgi:L-asparaginase